MSDTQYITSANNQTIKRVKRLLTSSRFRREQAEVVAEGIHLTKSYLVSGGTPKTYLYAESAIVNPEVSSLIEKLQMNGVVGAAVKDSVFEAVFDIHAGVGIAIVFELPINPQRRDEVGDELLLEDVQDPGNIGTILRTAAAVGVQCVYLSANSSSVWSPKALRGGMGAQFSLNIYEGVDLVEHARHAQVPLFVTSLEKSESIYEIDMTHPIGWVFGNEGQGVSTELMELASKRVTIPQAVTAVESLNVSAAVAVCLFEQQRQRLVA